MGAAGNGPKALAVIWSLTGFAAIVLSLRVYCKLLRHRGLWWDDHVLLVSYICLLGGSITAIVAVQYGWGKTTAELSTDNQIMINFLLLIIETFSITAALWSKTSFGITMLRITKGPIKMLIWVCIGTMNVFMILSAIFTWASCTPVARTWNTSVPGTCWDTASLIKYNIFSAAYSGCMDVIFALIPWTVIPKLQMRLKEKIGVSIAMSMGIFAGVTAFAKCAAIMNHSSGQDTYADVDLVIWGYVEPATAVIAISIPILRALFSELRSSASRYNTTIGGRSGRTKSGGTQIRTRNMRRVSTHVTGGLSEILSDNASDKSILDTREEGIIKTDEVVITHSQRADGEGEQSFEMTYFDPVETPRRSER
ncbi:hypothetical protein BX600DRAFT_498161 [Xylariales sp. PMI_506]|nr:hypothetical protein BX600DRAFT_498161 [Xylariales sp. PMI_506]